MEKYGNLSEEEVREILERSQFKTSDDLMNEIDNGPSEILLDRRASKPLSKNQATGRIHKFYTTLMRLVLDDNADKIIDLIQNSYAFDFEPLAKIVAKHNLKPETTFIRLYPALGEKDGKAIMTMVVTLEDKENMETITRDYLLGNLEAKTAPDTIQDEFSDEICPTNPNCPKTFNPLITEDEISSYKGMTSNIIQAKIAKSQRPV